MDSHSWVQAESPHVPIDKVLDRPPREWLFLESITPFAWLKQLVLPPIDRLEMNKLLTDVEQVQQRVKELEQVIAQRCGVSAEAVLLSSIPGVSYFTATSLACRVGRIERFPRAHSLANYWGLTPGCGNSGETNQRLGSITKAGSGMAR
jgi:transposase